MQQRSGFFACLERIDHHRQIAIFDAHEIGRVFGEISVIGDNEDDRFADITDPADSQRPLMHRRLKGNQKRIGQAFDVVARNHRPNAGSG